MGPAVLSLVLYTIGIPGVFLGVLVRHGAAIKRDQVMRAANQGGTEASNPSFFIRQRYQELYRCACVSVAGCSRAPLQGFLGP